MVNPFYYKQLEFQERTSGTLLDLFKKLEVTVNFESTQERTDLSTDFRVIRLCLQFLKTKPNLVIKHSLKKRKINYDPSANENTSTGHTLNQKLVITNSEDIRDFLIFNLSRFNIQNVSLNARKTRFNNLDKNGFKSVQLDFDFLPARNTHIFPISIFDIQNYASPKISFKLTLNPNKLSNFIEAFPFLSYIPTIKVKKKAKYKSLKQKKLGDLYQKINPQLIRQEIAN